MVNQLKQVDYRTHYAMIDDASLPGGIGVDLEFLLETARGWEGLSDEAVERRIYQLQDAIISHGNFDPSCNRELVIDHHAPDIYMREMFAPKGCFVIGAKHRTDHFNIVLSGSVAVLMAGKFVRVNAPEVIRSGAGVKKLGIVLEDLRWVTVHANPTQEKDSEKLEDLFTLEPPSKLHKELLVRKELRLMDQKLGRTQ